MYKGLGDGENANLEKCLLGKRLLRRQVQYEEPKFISFAGAVPGSKTF